MRHAFSIMLAAILSSTTLSGCQSTQSGSVPVDTATADAIYRAVLRSSPQYGEMIEDRAMAACIDWKAARGTLPTMRHGMISYMTPGSDVRLANELDILVLRRCNEARKRRGSQCDCALVLKNDKVVLRIPSGVASNTDAEPSSEPARTAAILRSTPTRRRLKSKIPVTLQWDGQNGLASGRAEINQKGETGDITLNFPNGGPTCKGDWSWTRGQYRTSEVPAGVWSISCNNGLMASGTYTSANPASGIGVGKDLHDQRVIFTFGD